VRYGIQAAIGAENDVLQGIVDEITNHAESEDELRAIDRANMWEVCHHCSWIAAPSSSR